jgi:fructose-bisphosphate aldolase, class II
MPLVPALGQLQKAQAEGYALPCFDTFDMMGTQGLFDALEAKRAPGIIGIYARIIRDPYAPAFMGMVRDIAERATVPVSIILDHGGSFDDCMVALRNGFTDVMFDGSKLPYEENVAQTKLVVQAAHAVGATAEAELGHVGGGSDYAEFGAQGKGLTDPAMVERFVAETGIDYLAVAVGTAHGLYAGEPKLDLERLAAIRQRVDTPLVLHGGSGLSDAQYRECIERGVSKINIFTNLGVSAVKQTRATLDAESGTFIKLIDAIREGFRVEAERYLDIFGAPGHAD